nr:hypothetical protein [uncultured Rhodoferax sp.]
MTDVVDQVHWLNDLMAEITVASNWQILDISQMGQAIALFDEMTLQNAFMVE